MGDDILRTRDDAAHYLGTTTRTIDRMVFDGRLKPLFLNGNNKRFRTSALDALLTTAAPPQPTMRFGRALAVG